MANYTPLKSLAISMFARHSFPHKSVAFIKVRYPDGPKMLSVVVDKNRDLVEFCNWVTKPNHRKPGHLITAYNLMFIAFHEKTKGDKTLNMENNPKYLVSWSPKRGFFNKSSATFTNKL